MFPAYDLHKPIDIDLDTIEQRAMAVINVMQSNHNGTSQSELIQALRAYFRTMDPRVAVVLVDMIRRKYSVGEVLAEEEGQGDESEQGTQP